MANKTLFNTLAGRLIPRTDTVNREFAPAYAYAPAHALAQYAATGCLNSTFYAGAEEQLETVLDLAGKVEPEFTAKAAVYAREKAGMKDMPALLCAWLSMAEPGLLEPVFTRVIDNGRMLRNFVQIMRSGVVGRKSLGTRPKRLVRQWLETRSDDALFRASVGNDPSLADIVRMVHPRPYTREREALYGYLIGRDADVESLPALVREYEAYKQTNAGSAPNVPFQMLTSLELGREGWMAIARNAGWQMTRMNLNTFARHGVLEDEETVRLIAERLRDREKILWARAYPYQILTALVNTWEVAPEAIREALQDALEVALENVPAFQGRVVICPDLSGSMHTPVTGYRFGGSSSVLCVHVAGLMAAAVLRNNPGAMVIPFHDRVVETILNPRDSVLTNTRRLLELDSGGTNISAPLALMNQRKERADLVVYVSDNQSWVDAGQGYGTALLKEWERFKVRNPGARLACIDVQPYGTTQAREREDILNIGGFSDAVFDVLPAFATGELRSEHWVGIIESLEL